MTESEVLRKIDFIFFNAGAGHRVSASALRMVIEQQRRGWDVRMVNLQEVLDPLDIFRKVTGLRLEEVYNLMLKKGWTLGSPQLTRLMQWVIRLYHPKQVKLLRQLWRERRPDLVVSLVPNFNRALGESLRKELPQVPYVTILTDLADNPPHFWIERQDQYFICGTERAVEQALDFGHPKSHVFRTSGTILHPRYYAPVEVVVPTERCRLGLASDLPTGLVMFGGEGSGVMLEILKSLDRSKLDLQLILICGRNERLRRQLQRYKSRICRVVEGFTAEVPYYMHLSEFFIGKPGPGGVGEALAMGLPVIVERNAWTLPQERYNADWIRERGVGIVVRSFKTIATAVEELLRPENFKGFRANAASIQNRAVFEIPEILERILIPRRTSEDAG